VQLQHWFPAAIAVGNVSSLWLTTRGRVSGFVVLAATQLAFTAYSLFTGQPGFVIQNIVMTIMAALGVRKWLRDGVHRDTTH